MRAVADGTGEPVVNVAGVFLEAGVGGDVAQVMTLGAQSVVAAGGEIGWKIQIRNRQTGRWRLAHIVAPLENVRILRSVRTIGSRAAGFAIVVAVVAVRAENAGAHGAALAVAIQFEQVGAQAGLRKWAAAIMHHGMAGRR